MSLSVVMSSNIKIILVLFYFFYNINLTYSYGTYVGIIPYLSIHGHISETERIPKFLTESKAPYSVINDYHELIESNSGLTEAQLDEKVQEWVDMQSIEIQVVEIHYTLFTQKKIQIFNRKRVV